MPSAGCEPAIPAIKGLETYALNRTATMIGYVYITVLKFIIFHGLASRIAFFFPFYPHLFKMYSSVRPVSLRIYMKFDFVYVNLVDLVFTLHIVPVSFSTHI
jgi:hypothetical protein